MRTMSLSSANPRKSRASGRLTLKDVAQLAGVSPITASRVLRGTGKVDPELVRRVQEAAQSLNYTPDPAAQALASARSRSVVVLVPSLTNTVFAALVESLHTTLREAGYHILLGDTHYDHDEEERLLRSYLMHRPSGLIVTGFDRNESTRRLLETCDIPCVHIMELTRAPGVHCVGFSQQDSGQAITGYLLEQGARKIAYVAAQLDARAMQRAEGYRRAMRTAGCYNPSFELLSPSPSSLGLGTQLFRETLERHPDVEAIFFCNDNLAQGGLLEALRMGIKIPQELKVVGYNDVDESSFTFPRLTTVATPRAAMGEKAAEMLLALMRGEVLDSTAIDLGFRLVIRESA